MVAILLLAGLAQLGAPPLQTTVWPALIWLAVKVGALSYGGGYVIIPLMYGDAVEAQRWMSEQEFANAVAYGQITPGPVTHTVALVGYAAAGLGARSSPPRSRSRRVFAMVMLGAPHFERLRTSRTRARFLDGAGPAAAGAILGAAVPLLARSTTPGSGPSSPPPRSRCCARRRRSPCSSAARSSGVATTL